MSTQTRSRVARRQAFSRHLETIKPENREPGGIDLAQSVLVRGERLAAHKEAERAKAKAVREARRKTRQQAVDDQRDKGTPELRQKLKARVRTQSLLDRYFSRRSINTLQLHAGRRFYAAWTAAGASGAPIGSYAPKVDTSPHGGHMPRASFIGDQYQRALTALGPGLAPIAVHVCVNDLAAEDWATGAGRPKNDGMPLLRAALDLLVDHYRLRGRQHHSDKDIELSPG